MKKIYLFIAIFICFNEISSQNINTAIASFNYEDSSLVFEKTYIHTDRSHYITGENIWFKAYLVDASSNMLIDHSKNLYVELISPDLSISQKRLVQIEDGVGFGDFEIPDTLKTGRYLIRAYTNWMRNFGSIFYFNKEISIVNPTYDGHPVNGRKFAIQNGVDIQFFPEGGSLVDNIPSKVAFKAVDSTGKGCNVRGIIRSNSQQVVASFESYHLGMGMFSFTPYSLESYTAEVKTDNGQTYSISLPVVFRTGISLEVKKNNDKEVVLAIKVNQKTLLSFSDRIFHLKITSHNTDYITYDLKISSLANKLIIPVTELPEGIYRLTLISDDSTPLCERLVYINKKQEYKLSITSDRVNYTPRSEVKLSVSVMDTLGNPELATISLSAVDAGLTNNTDSSCSDISSYLLLESELKGHIEQPRYYFDTTKVDRWSKLDLLLLTQGWRDFIWKYLSNNAQSTPFNLESSLIITGNLRRVVLGKPIDKANVTLTLFDDSTRYYCFTRTDSLGRFRFDSLYFRGNLKVLLSAKADNKVLQELISLDPNNYKAPEIDYPYFQSTEDFISTITQLKNESIYQRMVKNKYRLSDTIVLDELVFKKYVRKNQLNDSHTRIYDYADDVLKITESDENYGDIISYIKGRVNGVNVFESYKNGFKEYKIIIGSDKILNYEGRNADTSPLYLLDGIPTNIDALLNVPVRMIDKVEIVKRNLAIFGSSGFFGVVSVLTKKESTKFTTTNTSSIKENLTGYDIPRLFYAPKYNTQNLNSEKPDFRTTIHWEPNIVTEGFIGDTIKFFNADKETTVEVKVEGITQKGIPIVGSIKYKVNGKQNKISLNSKKF